MTTIRKINVSEIEGRSLNDIDKSQHPQGQMALYEDGRNVWKLRLPEGGVISEGVVTENPTIELTPAGPDVESQKLVIKGGAPIGEETHLHLTTGNLGETSIFLGTDEHNVRTNVDGNIEINTYNYIDEETKNWLFDNLGNLTAPGDISLENGATVYKAEREDVFGAVPMGDISAVYDDDRGYEILVVKGNDELQLTTSGGDTLKFSNAGLTFPDSTVQTTAYAGTNGHTMFIDPNRLGDYTENGSADKPFKTFSAAIAAAESSDSTSFTFVVLGGTITENVDFSNTTFTFISISTPDRATFTGNITIANIPTLSQMAIRNIEVGGTFTITGDGTANQMNNISIYDSSFSGPVNITATNATAFYQAAFFGAVNFTNLSYLYINGAQFTANWTITVDDTGTYPVPSRGITPGTGGSIAIVYSTIANNLIFVKGGGAAYVFQPHMTRIGVGAGTYTIPAGWTVTPHSTVLRGTWVNDGTLALRNTSHDNPISGTTPTYVGTIGAGRIIAKEAPTSSKGAAGDKAGMIAVDSTYIYVCTTDYTTGVADIWTRNILTTGTW